jgi:hypothetical protein
LRRLITTDAFYCGQNHIAETVQHSIFMSDTVYRGFSVTLEQIRVAVLEAGSDAFASGRKDRFVGAIKKVIRHRATVIASSHINAGLRTTA